MGRILAIDYGLKRCGFAWTDLSRIIATPLSPCETNQIFIQLEEWVKSEPIDIFVLGKPLRFDNSFTHSTEEILNFGSVLQKKYEHIPLIFFDERFTSVMAKDAMIQAGATRTQKKK